MSSAEPIALSLNIPSSSQWGLPFHFNQHCCQSQKIWTWLFSMVFMQACTDQSDIFLINWRVPSNCKESKKCKTSDNIIIKGLQVHGNLNKKIILKLNGFFFLKQLLLLCPTLGDSDSPTASKSADSNWAFSPTFLQILNGETEESKGTGKKLYCNWSYIMHF